jgi:DNA-binding NarL/FixJ family response regulator
MPVSIILADEQPMLRRGLRSVLEADPQFSIIAEASDGLETIRLAERFEPNVVVLDLRLRSLNGLDALSIIKQRSPRTQAVVFSALSGEESILQALRNGALAYVLKQGEIGNVLEAVQRASCGRRYLGPEISERALEAYQEKALAGRPDPHSSLSAREREVLQLSAEGQKCPAIAGRLSISPRTAEVHRRNAMRKLGLKTDAELICYAIRRGMITLEE